MSRINRKLLMLCMVLLVGQQVACSVTHNEPTETVALPTMEKLNLNVELRLPEGFRNAKWQGQSSYYTRIQPLGTALSRNAEATARAVFKIVELKNAEPPSKSETPVSADAILVPELVSVERDRPPTISSTQTTSMRLTWTLWDRSGKILWVATITGEGKGPMGALGETDSGVSNMQNAILDLFQKSGKEMVTSSLIRQYATRH